MKKEMLRMTECYPYLLQEWGFQVWNAAPGSPIRRIDVEQATPNVIAHLDANFFRARFDRLTALQQKYLRAMAQLSPGPYKTGDIAATLGVTAAAVATVRQQLILRVQSHTVAAQLRNEDLSACVGHRLGLLRPFRFTVRLGRRCWHSGYWGRIRVWVGLAGGEQRRGGEQDQERSRTWLLPPVDRC
jgi:hypothetical protein